MPTLPVDLNTAVQDALQTRAEVIAAAQAQGHAVDAADIIMNPDTGLLRLELMTSADLSQNAIDAINANNGAAKVGPPLPDPLFVLNLENLVTTPILQTIVLSPAAGQLIAFHMIPPASTATPVGDMGRITGDGASNTYTNNHVNLSPSLNTHALVEISTSDPSPFTIADAELTATFDGAQSLVADLGTSIVVPAAGAGVSDFERMSYWWDVTGKMYLGRHQARRAGVDSNPVPGRSYADSVAAGAQ